MNSIIHELATNNSTGWKKQLYGTIIHKIMTNQCETKISRTDEGKIIIITTDSDIINENVLKNGILNSSILFLDFDNIKIFIGLEEIINRQVKNGNHELVELMMSLKMDIFGITNDLMYLCVDSGNYDLVLKIIEKGVNVGTNYDFMYKLASIGKLDLITEIMKRYEFVNIREVVSKICVHAIIENQISILKHFLTKKVFKGAYDIMYCFFVNSVKNSCNLEIVKFFVDSGICIGHENYEVVHLAIKLKRWDIVKYFSEKVQIPFEIGIDL